MMCTQLNGFIINGNGGAGDIIEDEETDFQNEGHLTAWKDNLKKQPQQQLYDAIHSQDISKLKQLLTDMIVDIDLPDWNGTGNPPLLDAAKIGNLEMVRLLCENGCERNVRSLRGETPLHVAVTSCNFKPEMIYMLVDCGCNPDIQENLGGQTALHIFIKKHISSTAVVSQPIFNVFQLLVRITNINIQDHRLRSPLHNIAACKYVDKKLLKVLSEDCNEGLDLQNNRGETALHEALEHNNIEFAILLTDKKANTSLTTKYRETALHIAARKNMNRVVEALLKHDSPVNAQELYGNTALHLAASKGYKDVVKSIISSDKVLLNISNKEGLTPLHLAVESGFIFVVELLLRAESCDVTARTKRSETALDLAQQEYRRRSQPEMTEVISREMQRRSCGKPEIEC